MRRYAAEGRRPFWRAAVLSACVSCGLGEAGCSDGEPAPESISMPGAPAASYVLGFTTAEGAVLGLVAAPADQPIRARGFPADSVVHLLAYRESLPELGLEAGEIARGAACARSCVLVRPAASWSRPLGAGDWSPAPVPERVADQLIPDRVTRCGCADLGFEIVTYDTTVPVIFAVPRADGALVGFMDGSLLHVGRDHQLTPICRPTPYGPFFAGFAAREGTTVWLGGRTFVTIDLAQARPDAPCPIQPAPARLRDDPIMDLDGPPDGEPFELYALSSSGAFARFDGAAWTELAAVTPEVGATVGQVRWLAPGSAAAAYQSHELALSANGSTQVESVVLSVDTYGIQSIGVSSRHGLLLGAYHVGLLGRIDGSWRPLAVGLRRINVIGFIAELGDRLFYSWGRGQIAQLVGGAEACADLVSGLPVLHRRPVVMNERELLIGSIERNTEFPGQPTYLLFARVIDGCEGS